ncbi:MAG: shikimate kinase [Candidatus Hydrothermarchaeota archaeon]
MRNIVLTGFMGAGKSTVGRRLGERLGMEVVDTDDLVEEMAGMRISAIFSAFGEAYFRDLESKAVARVSEREDRVIVTGGGVVLRMENITNLRRKGVIVYLHAEPNAIYERIKGERHRPLLQVKDPLARIRELLASRAPYYAENDLLVDTSSKTVEEVVNEVVEKVRRLAT